MDKFKDKFRIWHILVLLGLDESHWWFTPEEREACYIITGERLIAISGYQPKLAKIIK